MAAYNNNNNNSNNSNNATAATTAAATGIATQNYKYNYTFRAAAVTTTR